MNLFSLWDGSFDASFSNNSYLLLYDYVCETYFQLLSGAGVAADREGHRDCCSKRTAGADRTTTDDGDEQYHTVSPGNRSSHF